MPPTNGAMSAGLLGFVVPENSWRPLNHFLHENMVVLHLRHHGGLEKLPFSWLLERQHSAGAAVVHAQMLLLTVRPELRDGRVAVLLDVQRDGARAR